MIDFDDEYSGQGGSYLLNTETGKRTLIERTQEPQEIIEQPQPAADKPADPQGE